MAKGKKKRAKRATKGRTYRRLFAKVLAVASLLALVAGGLYLLLLDIRLRQEFEGRRWALPARVYARPLALYVGAGVSKSQLVKELERLGYERRDRVGEPGSYAASAGAVQFHRRAFRFWDETAAPQRVHATFETDRLVALSDSAAPLDLVRIDAPLIGSFYPATNEDRVLLRLEEVPTLLIDALIAMEDRGFYEHRGISVRGMARALIADIKAGSAVQGGSTLTQQLVKNFYLSSERTLSRKLREVVMALLLELHYGKDEILETYLNEVFLGQAGRRAIHGFAQGSWLYFGRPLGELDSGRLALLAGMVKAPSTYDPRRHPDKAKLRRDLVLKVLEGQGKLDSATATTARQQPIAAVEGSAVGGNRYPHFLDLVRRQLRRDYPESVLREEGLRLFTTLDPGAQAAAERALRDMRSLPKAKLEGAVVVADIATGEVLAVAGGRDAGSAGFNRALDAVRPIGSLVKPAVYLAALERPTQYHLGYELADEPITVALDNGTFWEPENADSSYRGRVSLLQGLVHSRNVPTVNLGLEVGLGAVTDSLRRLGIQRRITERPSLLLGTLELAPIEVAQMYLTLAASGFHTSLRAIREVTDHGGSPINRYPLRLQRTVAEIPAYLINVALQEVVASGTGRRMSGLLAADLRIAGKTGTTDDTRDSWFAGFTGDKVAVVWVGRDDNGVTGLHGATGALPVWAAIMKALGPTPVSLIPPAGVTWMQGVAGQGVTETSQGCAPKSGFPVNADYAPITLRPCGPEPFDAEPVTRPLRWMKKLFRP